LYTTVPHCSVVFTSFAHSLKFLKLFSPVPFFGHPRLVEPSVHTPFSETTHKKKTKSARNKKRQTDRHTTIYDDKEKLRHFHQCSRLKYFSISHNLVYFSTHWPVACPFIGNTLKVTPIYQKENKNTIQRASSVILRSPNFPL
jgi:hypothetical protein